MLRTLITLTAILTGTVSHAGHTLDTGVQSVVETAMTSARARYEGRRDNCRQVALEAKRQLAAAGVRAHLVVIDRSPRINHAVLCLENGTCLDNGFMTAGTFESSELDHYKILNPWVLPLVQGSPRLAAN